MKKTNLALTLPATQKKPELLAPVGDLAMAKAAIAGKASSIYIGAPFFNARGRSKDFTDEELDEIFTLCHSHQVKVYFALNVLIFEEEIPKVEALVKKLLTFQPHAFIVQDIGLLQIIHRLNPKQKIHASTQMSITCHEAIEELSDLNIERFVLGRECSLGDMKIISQNSGVELEVFVHGALCVSYSGQCFTSEVIGGRSANRGQCAQSCRLGYEAEVDGELLPSDKKYVLSPLDLCSLEHVAELTQIGIDALKIEGRLKSPYYVATVCQNYRSAIDNIPVEKESFDEMAIAYSRGFHDGWFNTVDHQNLVKANYSKHRGLLAGKVVKVTHNKLIISSSASLHQGDGLLLVNSRSQAEYGGQIHFVEKNHQTFTLSLGAKFPYNKVDSGDDVFINRSQASIEKIDSLLKKVEVTKIPIEIEITALPQKPLQLSVTCADKSFEIIGTENAEPARTTSLDEEVLRRELGRLDRSHFFLQSLRLISPADVYLPPKELRLLRGQLLEQLEQQFSNRPIKNIKIVDANFPVEAIPSLRQSISLKKEVPTKEKTKNIKFNLLLRDSRQVSAVLSYLEENTEFRQFLNSVILDYEYGHQYQESMSLLKPKARDYNFLAGVATCRILKPLEYQNFRQIEKAEPDTILIRNLGALNYFKNSQKILLGDFSLNVSNSLTFEYLLSKGFHSLCLSYDLNEGQLSALLKNIDASQSEITIHQYMPEFHMEYCVYASLLSQGKNFKDCGRPCDRHQITLIDQNKIRHKIKADHECRNTLFQAQAQSSLSSLKTFTELGCRFFRFEALDETSEQLKSKLTVYHDFFQNKLSLQQAVTELSVSEKYGLSGGTLQHRHNYSSRKKV